MKKKQFIPTDWIENPQTTSSKAAVEPRPLPDAGSLAEDIEIVVSRIEDASVDITQGYDNWRNLGFAISDGLGEAGRDLFHRISRFNSTYDAAECDKQYTACLNGKREGITASTFFHKAKLAGINIQTGSSLSPKLPKSPISPVSPSANSMAKSPRSGAGDNGDIGNIGEADHVALPTFSDQIIDKLPSYLAEVASYGRNPKETDTILLSAITVISGCLPNVQGTYDNRTVFANLFFFISARAGAGKGRAELCQHLAYPIHRRLKESYKRELAKYEADMLQWEATPKRSRGSKPEKPKQTMLYIPSDISATAFTQLLNENDGRGIIFDSEADGLANSFETDFGDYSKTFRAAFHHERAAYHRRTGDEDVEIEKPKISAFLTGTPQQVLRLIKDAENGLFSRFGFYRLETELVWRSVLANQSKETLDDTFEELGERFTEFYDILRAQPPIQFSVTEAQGVQFDAFFSELMYEYQRIFKDDILGSVFRLGLICYRICMVLSAVRIMDTGDYGSSIVCSDQDFETALTISRTLAVHMAKIYDELCSADFSRTAIVAKSAKRQRFLAALPDEFDRQGYLAAAEKVGVPPDTADKWVRAFCAPDGPLEKVDHGQYKKL